MIIWYVAAALLCGKATSLHERNARPLNKCYRRFRRHCWHYTQSKSRPLFIYLFIFLHKSTVPFNCSMCVSFAIYSSPVLKVIQENEVCPPIAFYLVWSFHIQLEIEFVMIVHGNIQKLFLFLFIMGLGRVQWSHSVNQSVLHWH